MNHSYGPWATAIYAHADPQLSRFWQRRLIRLPAVAKSKPAMTRPAVVTMLVAAVAIGLMPTLYGSDPLEGGKAIAAPPEHSRPNESEATKASRPESDGIDLTFIPATTNGLIVVRPAALREHLAQGPQGFHWDETIVPCVLAADLRQYAMAGFRQNYVRGGWMLGCEWCAAQSLRPLAVKPFLDWHVTTARTAERDYEGKKLYQGILGNGKPTAAALQYDDRTLIVISKGEQSVPGYLSGQRGLPTWLPAKEWEEFHGDDMVIAFDRSIVRNALDIAKEHPSSEFGTSLPMLRLLEDSQFVVLGVRLGESVRTHGLIAAADDAGAARLEDAASRVVAMIRATRAAVAKKKQLDPVDAALIAVEEPILAAMRISRAGNTVRMESLIPAVIVQHALLSLTATDSALPKSPPRKAENPAK